MAYNEQEDNVFNNVAVDRSKRSTPAGEAEVISKACICTRSGVQRVDEHNWCRNYVDSGDFKGARSNTSSPADSDYRRIS